MVGNVALFFVILNSIIGGGIFINLGLFSQQGGVPGLLLYPLGFLIFAPIIFCLGTIAQTFQSEGGLFYVIKNQLGERLAFVAVWCYFLGRAVSVAVLLRALCNFLQTDYAIFASMNEFFLITGLAIFICVANFLGVSNTGRMQKAFILFKIMPIVVLIILGSIFFNKENLLVPFDAKAFFDKLNFLLPPAIYALQGFTIIFHIGHRIKHPQNIRKILLLATFSAALLYSFFQFIVFCKVGTTAGNLLLNFVNAIHISNPLVIYLFTNLVTIAVFSSCFMILTGNSWNLFTLAKNNYLPFGNFLTKTKNNAPVVCLFLHAASSLFFVFVCKNVVALQATSVVSAFITYLICCIAGTIFLQKQEIHLLWIGILALIFASGILKIAFMQTLKAGISVEFLVFLFLGLGLFLVQNYKVRFQKAS